MVISKTVNTIELNKVNKTYSQILADQNKKINEARAYIQKVNSQINEVAKTSQDSMYREEVLAPIQPGQVVDESAKREGGMYVKDTIDRTRDQTLANLSDTKKELFNYTQEVNSVYNPVRSALVTQAEEIRKGTTPEYIAGYERGEGEYYTGKLPGSIIGIPSRAEVDAGMVKKYLTDKGNALELTKQEIIARGYYYTPVKGAKEIPQAGFSLGKAFVSKYGGRTPEEDAELRRQLEIQKEATTKPIVTPVEQLPEKLRSAVTETRYLGTSTYVPQTPYVGYEDIRQKYYGVAGSGESKKVAVQQAGRYIEDIETSIKNVVGITKRFIYQPISSTINLGTDLLNIPGSIYSAFTGTEWYKPLSIVPQGAIEENILGLIPGAKEEVKKSSEAIDIGLAFWNPRTAFDYTAGYSPAERLTSLGTQIGLTSYLLAKTPIIRQINNIDNAVWNKIIGYGKQYLDITFNKKYYTKIEQLSDQDFVITYKGKKYGLTTKNTDEINPSDFLRQYKNKVKDVIHISADDMFGNKKQFEVVDTPSGKVKVVKLVGGSEFGEVASYRAGIEAEHYYGSPERGYLYYGQAPSLYDINAPGELSFNPFANLKNILKKGAIEIGRGEDFGKIKAPKKLPGETALEYQSRVTSKAPGELFIPVENIIGFKPGFISSERQVILPAEFTGKITGTKYTGTILKSGTEKPLFTYFKGKRFNIRDISPVNKIPSVDNIISDAGLNLINMKGTKISSYKAPSIIYTPADVLRKMASYKSVKTPVTSLISYKTPSYKAPSVSYIFKSVKPSYETPSYKAPSYKSVISSIVSKKAPSYETPSYKPSVKIPSLIPSYKAPSYTPSYKTPSYKPPTMVPSYKPPYYTPSYKPPAYKPPYKPPVKGISFKIGSAISNLFRVEIKRRGKFKTAGITSDLASALTTGKGITKKTLARTFKVTKLTPGAVSYPSFISGYRKKIRRGREVSIPGLYIQKKGIETKPEVAEIQFYRRTAKKSKGKRKIRRWF